MGAYASFSVATVANATLQLASHCGWSTSFLPFLKAHKTTLSVDVYTPITLSFRVERENPVDFILKRGRGELTGLERGTLILCHTLLPFHGGTSRCVVLPTFLPLLPLSSGQGQAHEGLLRAAGYLLHFHRGAEPVSCTPLIFHLHHSSTQNDAGGVYHGGVRCPRSWPSGGGGHLGMLGRPLPTSPNSQTGGRSVSVTGCFWFCIPGGTGSSTIDSL